MTQIEFIKNWLENSKEILHIESALYEYHTYSETHFLRLFPDSILSESRFDNAISDLIIEFDKQFPSEGLCLIGDDSLTKLENPEELLQLSIPVFTPLYETFPGSSVILTESEFVAHGDWSGHTTVVLNNMVIAEIFNESALASVLYDFNLSTQQLFGANLITDQWDRSISENETEYGEEQTLLMAA